MDLGDGGSEYDQNALYGILKELIKNEREKNPNVCYKEYN